MNGLLKNSDNKKNNKKHYVMKPRHANKSSFERRAKGERSLRELGHTMRSCDMLHGVQSFLNATADQHFFDGSNARWVGLLFASNAPLCGAEQGSNARGLPGGGMIALGID